MIDPFPGRVSDDLGLALMSAVGPDHVLVAPQLTEGYRIDWTGRFRADPTVVVRPADTDQVSAVVRACAEHRVAICTQGGNTGLVGGGVPLNGEVVISTRRLQRLAPVDTVAATVIAGAGVTLRDLQRHATAAGMRYGVDLAARDSATVGGTVATNAGGNNVIRYGMTRHNLAGIEVVLADGSVLSDLRGLPKDNTGYHLPGLFCGSEGTLGVITAANLRLHWDWPERVTALLAFESLGDALTAAATLAAAKLPLEAVELMLDAGFELVSDTFGLASPFPTRHPAYLVVECADVDPVTDRLSAVIDRLEGFVDAAVADDSVRAGALWAHRERHAEAVNSISPPLKLDVSVPVNDIARFIDAVAGHIGELHPGARLWLWGHAGDGNIHVNITGLAESDERACTDDILNIVASFEGSVSAEHGIGRLKREWLIRQRGPVGMEALRAIKDAFDPHGVFQPGVMLFDSVR